jgi:hypothetical protein
MPQWAAVAFITAGVALALASRKLPWSKSILTAVTAVILLSVCIATGLSWQPIWWLLSILFVTSYLATCIAVVAKRKDYSMDVAIVGLTIPILYPFLAASRIIF